MNRVCLGLLRRVEDLVDNQIAFARRRRPDRICLIRHAHVKRAAVGFRIYGNRQDSHFAARPNNAHRNFTPVGNQDLVKHRFIRGSSF